MAKTTPVKKIVNGEIADGDDINQITENIGTEGGLIPYSAADQEKVTDGTESLGATAYPWGSAFLNREANFVEVDPSTNTASSSITMSHLRKFISQKDTPSTYGGAGGQVARVNVSEDGLEFGIPSNTELFASNGTFTVPAGVTKVYLTMIGGGGGGAGGGQSGSSEGGGGGGGGDSLVNFPYTVTPATGYAVVVGAGGNGGSAAAAGTNGVVGANTTFNATIIARGGNFGVAGTLGVTGVGGSARNADATTHTDVGTYSNGCGAGGKSGDLDIGGAGGGSIVGAGALGGDNAAGAAAAANSGGGGGGGGKNTGGRAGGNGGSGILLVTW